MSTSPSKVPMTNQGPQSSPREEQMRLLGLPTEEVGRNYEEEHR